MCWVYVCLFGLFVLSCVRLYGLLCLVRFVCSYACFGLEESVCFVCDVLCAVCL